MNAKLQRHVHRIKALDTAIILIAFVVVAAIFAFTVLSTGTFLTEKSKEASYAGLQEVRGSLALRGSVVITGTGQNSANRIIVTLGPVAGGSSVDVSQISITYRDKNSSYNVPFGNLGGAGTTNFTVTNPLGNVLPGNILDQGSLGVFTIQPKFNISTPYFTFGLEIMPPTGGDLLVLRTAPPLIDTVTDLK